MTNALHKANNQTLNSAETEKISQSCKKRGLTVKQEAFVQAYIESGSASQAYRDAYDVSADTKRNCLAGRLTASGGPQGSGKGNGDAKAG